MTPLERVLSLLEGVRATSWTARCPAHDDRDARLSITETNGRALFKCLEGCSGFALQDALRLKASKAPSPLDAALGLAASESPVTLDMAPPAMTPQTVPEPPGVQGAQEAQEPAGATLTAETPLEPSDGRVSLPDHPGVIEAPIVAEVRAALAAGPASFRALRTRIGRRWELARTALQALVDAQEVAQDGHRGRHVRFRLVPPGRGGEVQVADGRADAVL